VGCGADAEQYRERVLSAAREVFAEQGPDASTNENSAGTLFEQGEVDIDPEDDKLAAQLGSIKCGIDSRGRIKIETKDDMRKRGLSSPDRADTAAMAFSARANAAPMNVESHAGESITGDLMTKGGEKVVIN
jgi:hypothetical protein